MQDWRSFKGLSTMDMTRELCSELVKEGKIQIEKNGEVVEGTPQEHGRVRLRLRNTTTKTTKTKQR
jgi:hypothetical protein